MVVAPVYQILHHLSCWISEIIYIIEQLLALAGLVVVTEVFKFLEGHIYLLEQEAHELIAGNGLIILKANQGRAIEIITTNLLLTQMLAFPNALIDTSVIPPHNILLEKM